MLAPEESHHCAFERRAPPTCCPVQLHSIAIRLSPLPDTKFGPRSAAVCSGADAQAEDVPLRQ